MAKGRPKKPAGEARDTIFRIRVTDAERELFNEAARAKGLDSSAWARSELLTVARALLQSGPMAQAGENLRGPTRSGKKAKNG